MNTLSPKQAAAELGCSVWLVYRLFADGELRGFRVRTVIRIYADSLREFVEQNKNEVRTKPVIQQGEMKVPQPPPARPVLLPATMVARSCLRKEPDWQAD